MTGGAAAALHPSPIPSRRALVAERLRLSPLVAATPALVAAFPGTFVWTANFDEITGPDAALTLALLGAIGVAVHLVVTLLSRRRLSAATAALVATLVNAILFCVVIVAERLPLRFRYAVALLALPLVAAIIWLWTVRRRGAHAARVAGLVTLGVYASLALIPLRMTLTKHALWPELQRERTISTPIVNVAPASATNPDMYLFLLDTYGSRDVLTSVYGVNDDAFYDSLRTLGFALPQVHANYAATSPALASLLNATYLDSLTPLLDGRTRRLWPLYELIHHDRVTAFLTRLGYHAYVVPSVGWVGTLQHSVAQVHLRTPTVGAVRGQWMRGLLLYYTWPHTLASRLLPWHARWSSSSRVRSAFEGTRQLVGAPGPKFVLVHSMASHFPFTVGPRCEESAAEFSDHEGTTGPPRDVYQDGIRCTNREVLSVVTEILRRSTTPPIILIQGDHGPRGLGIPFDSGAHRITAAQAVDRFSVIGAYYLPAAPGLLPDTVTPVNVMRAVLSHYFGADLPPLPDRSLHATNDHPYRFYQIPDAFFHDSATRVLNAYVTRESKSVINP